MPTYPQAGLQPSRAPTATSTMERMTHTTTPIDDEKHPITSRIHTLPPVYASAHRERKSLSTRPHYKTLDKVMRGDYAHQESSANATYAQQVAHTSGVILAAGLSLSNPTDILSHHSAATLWGLPEVDPDNRFHVYRLENRNRTRQGFAIHAGDLPQSDYIEIGGIQVTTLARTAVDLARTLQPASGLAVLDAARRMGVSVHELQEIAERMQGNGRVRARSLVPLSVSNSDSVPESQTRYWVLQSKVGAVVTQHPLRTWLGRFRTDMAIPSKMLACEFDGKSKYSSKDDFVEEKRREDSIRELGWEFIRVTFKDLLRPELLVRRIQAAAGKFRG